MTTKTCNTCGETKPAKDFYPKKTSRDRLTGGCRECVKAYSRRWWAKHKERMA